MAHFVALKESVLLQQFHSDAAAFGLYQLFHVLADDVGFQIDDLTGAMFQQGGFLTGVRNQAHGEIRVGNLCHRQADATLWKC